MHVLVVFAHPRRASFTGALLDHFVSGLHEAGHTTEIADLYAENFDPSLGPADLAQFEPGGVMPADVLREQARVDAADALAFVFPVWWWSFPAILKGWIDRVWSQGWAYDFTVEKTAGLLKQRKAVMLCNGGTTHQTYRRYGYYGAMQRQLDIGILHYCGITDTAIHVFPGVDDLAAARPVYLAKAKEIGRRFAESDDFPIGTLA